uniref:Homing endonuclease LAGLIDADG domain-containing protein n=1 Tax=Capillidium heterosporum TaxID=1167838 RepID=A0A3Q9U0A1_9FUNG|nr:hypothetical protein [Capillidium heterosporum]AZZ06712.1 hypothetical protein [Capillidium heterosporum]
MEVIEPTITLKFTGFLLCGLKLYIINKRKDTYENKIEIIGEKNNIFNQDLINLNIMKFNIPNIRADKRIGPHNKEIISVIIGSLLGDAYGNRKSIEGIRIVYKQGIKNKEYLFWLYEFFYKQGYCTNLLPRKYTRKLKKGDQIKEYFGYEFNTFTFRSLNWIHKMFYKKGVKVLKMELEKYFSPLALAIWCMSSGKHINGRIELSTNLRRDQDMEKLIKMLNNRFGLNCDINKQKKDLYVVVISKESVKLLQTIVLPNILPTMKHKIGLYNNTTEREKLGKKKGNRFYTTLNNPRLNPYYITGFADGESNFTIIITKNKSLKVGYRVQPSFQINLHKKDINLLNKIKSFWAVGKIYEQKESCIYVVNSFKDLPVIIEHLDKYPLITQKQAD